MSFTTYSAGAFAGDFKEDLGDRPVSHTLIFPHSSGTERGTRLAVFAS